jgi:hypothetical protein
MSQFNVGDTVTKMYGKKPATILRQVSWRSSNSKTCWYCQYLAPSKGCFEAFENELKLYEPLEEIMADTKTLYSFKKEDGTIAYGSHIGTNSSNNYLIEEKGTNNIHVIAPADLEEVLPYTFSAAMNGKETHYVCQPDTVKKGDYLLYTNGTTPQIAVVIAVDTKNKNARSKFRGKRLVLDDL